MPKAAAKSALGISYTPAAAGETVNRICRQRLTLTSGFGAQSKTPSSS
jgi:hypothetical protein